MSRKILPSVLARQAPSHKMDRRKKGGDIFFVIQIHINQFLIHKIKEEPYG